MNPDEFLKWWDACSWQKSNAELDKFGRELVQRHKDCQNSVLMACLHYENISAYLNQLEQDNIRLRNLNEDRIGEAMQDVWNDHCNDTGCVPDCIEIHGPKTTRVTGSFEGSVFASRVAEHLKLLEQHDNPQT